MANQDHVELLKYDVPGWNNWRQSNPQIRPDLREANLSKVDLSEANLAKADLFGADLTEANLTGAVLNRADISFANLSCANLSYTKLLRVECSGTIFNYAKFHSTVMPDGKIFTQQWTYSLGQTH